MKETVSPEYQAQLDTLAENLITDRRKKMTENVVELRPIKSAVEIDVINSNIQKSMRWI